MYFCSFSGKKSRGNAKYIIFIVLWNKIETKQNITISVEFERPSDNNLMLAEFADVIFVSKEFASHHGYTRDTAVYELKKYTKKR